MLKLKCLEAEENYSSALNIVEVGRTNVEELDRQQEIRLEEARILMYLGQIEQALTRLQ